MRNLRREIENEENEVNVDKLLEAWDNRNLTTDDELKAILRNAYAGMETRASLDAHALIGRAADLMGPQLKIAEAALVAARATAKLEMLRIAKKFESFSTFTIVTELEKEVHKDG